MAPQQSSLAVFNCSEVEPSSAASPASDNLHSPQLPSHGTSSQQFPTPEFNWHSFLDSMYPCRTTIKLTLSFPETTHGKKIHSNLG